MAHRIKRVRLKTKNRVRSPQSYSPRQKLESLTWKFTIGDADDHPSVPHGHAAETGERLDVWTGKIYPKGNERVKVSGTMKKKDLAILHRDPKFIEYATKQIKWYREEYPGITFYVPEWFELKYLRTKKLLVTREEDENQEFIFICQVIKY